VHAQRDPSSEARSLETRDLDAEEVLEVGEERLGLCRVDGGV
jgi:hypothetical protein